jgi:hypothetical protein
MGFGITGVSPIMKVQYLGVSMARTYYYWLVAFTACFEPYNPEALRDYGCISNLNIIR